MSTKLTAQSIDPIAIRLVRTSSQPLLSILELTIAGNYRHESCNYFSFALGGICVSLSPATYRSPPRADEPTMVLRDGAVSLKRDRSTEFNRDLMILKERDGSTEFDGDLMILKGRDGSTEFDGDLMIL
ncbi:hypothetical protein CHU98_g8985 [Xylaria longipes]|nr:hypothetical protein CHU98_g8985 [Xylaria longipes]